MDTPQLGPSVQYQGSNKCSQGGRGENLRWHSSAVQQNFSKMHQITDISGCFKPQGDIKDLSSRTLFYHNLMISSGGNIMPPTFPPPRIFRSSYDLVKVPHAFPKYLLVFNSSLSKTCLKKIALDLVLELSKAMLVIFHF